MKRLRRAAFGLSTVLGLAERGFFIPYRYAGMLPKRHARPSYVALERWFSDAEPTFLALIRSMQDYAGALAAIGGAPPPEPRFEQDWFPRLDAVALYTFVREARPARIVEVGSGHSTRFIGRAVRDGALATAITAIDPEPRADIGGTGAEVTHATVQEAGTAPFEALTEGDILFVDSSHILMPGTDVDFLFNHVLPILPRGVLVHVHDIFLPDEYPPDWEWRGYNEQLAVATLIQGGAFRLLWSSRYAATRMAKAVANSVAGPIPLKPGAMETSLWLAKV
jgi:hypothetical protein